MLNLWDENKQVMLVVWCAVFVWLYGLFRSGEASNEYEGMRGCCYLIVKEHTQVNKSYSMTNNFYSKKRNSEE